jgi:hypothetical protein
MYVLKFAYSHGTLNVERFSGDQAITTAIRRADIAADEGSESLAYIDVWENGKRTMTMTAEEVFAEAQKLRPLTPKVIPPAAKVMIRGSDRRWALEGYYRSSEAAESAGQRWRSIVGAENVRVGSSNLATDG